MNRCHVIKDLLLLHIDGLLSEPTRSFVERHLSACSECAQECRQLQAAVVSPIVPTAAKEDQRVLRRIKITLNCILYPLMLLLLMACCAVFLLLHIYPCIKALPLIACGFLSYLLLKKPMPTIALAAAAALSVPQISRDMTPATTQMIFLAACLFYVSCGFSLAWAVGKNSRQQVGGSHFSSLPAPRVAKVLFCVFLIAALSVTSITTSRYSNLWEYAWTKALFESYIRDEEIAGGTLSSFSYDSHQYVGTITDGDGEDYLITIGGRLGLGLDCSYDYLKLNGSNNLHEQQALMDIMVSNGFRLRSVNDVYILVRDEQNGVFTMNADGNTHTISPVYRYSIFAPHSDDALIELRIRLDAYGDEIQTQEDFERFVGEAVQLLRSLSLHYDALVFEYKHYRVELPGR